MNMKFVRTWAMLALVMVIGLSVTGGTIAWFTDSVSSTNNVIKSGTLDIQLLEGTTEVTADTQLFNYLLWEPGYVAMKNLTIKNNGDLALKYTFGINPGSIPEDAKLAEVIDVYSFPAGTEVTRAVVNAATPVGTLKELSAEGNTKVVSTGNLTRGQTEDVILVLKMRESAGNEYQNLSLNNVGISLLATQYTYEEDAFDNQYDAEATYDGTVNKGDDDETINTESQLPGVKASIDPLSGDKLNVVFSDIFENVVPSGINERVFGDVALDCGIKLSSTETDIENSPYKKWYIDFEISSSKDLVAANEDCWITLGGHYDFDQLAATGEWLGGKIYGVDLLANTKVPVMSGLMGVPMNYEEVVNSVQDFSCGLQLGDYFDGAIITLELCAYDPATNDRYVISTYTYTHSK